MDTGELEDNIDRDVTLVRPIEGTTKINIEADYDPIRVNAKLLPYEVKANLSNVENPHIFDEFSQEQLDLLVKNNFVVRPTKEEQLFYIYEDNDYRDIPSFITTDSVLQVYHIFYDYALRNLEEEILLGEIEDLTGIMLYKSIDLYNEIESPKIKEIQLKNVAYFAIGQMSLGNTIPDSIPAKAMDIAEEELKKIERHSGFEKSSLFPYKIDYSQFTIRGHYTRSRDLERYFRAVMWYGQAPFPLYFNVEERNEEQTIQAMLITNSILSDKMAYKKWEKVYGITEFFVGSSDDLDIYQYSKLLYDIYGDELNLNDIDKKEKMDKFYEEADKLPEPKIKAKYTEVDTPTGKQFRFMGQRYVMDADIIQQLVEPIVRPIPSGLDIMGVLGSQRAKEIQLSKEVNKNWEDYPKKLDELGEKFASMDERQWHSNMYTGWLWVLKGFLEPFGEGYPSFMTNAAWIDKDLNSALGSWSELKHDTILYGKQSGAEMGGDIPEAIVGYVEPNIEVYEKLLWLTKFSKKNLKARDVDLYKIDNAIDRFQWLLEFLINCSVKELNGEELSIEEYDTIRYYGGILEDLTCSFAGDGLRWFEITSETDKNMAIIADFHTIAPNKYGSGGYMEAGVGPAYEIFVVVPIGGKLYLTRGAVFSYHEFISTERLTDEKWQEIIEEGLAPPMPPWTSSFIR